MKRITKAFAALGVAAGAIIGSTAQAQSVNVNADLTVARALRLYVDRQLHFGLVTAADGLVTIDASDAGSRSTGGPALLSNAAHPVSSAVVRAVGEPDTALWITLTDPGELDNASSGDALDFLLASDLPLSPRTDNPGGGADGTFIFHLGGQVTVNSTSSGTYAGTIRVSAAYN